MLLPVNVVADTEGEHRNLMFEHIAGHPDASVQALYLACIENFRHYDLLLSVARRAGATTTPCCYLEHSRAVFSVFCSVSWGP